MPENDDGEDILFWKGAVLPRVLHGRETVVWSRGDLESIQRIENGVWRTVLRNPDYTPIATLQGEIECSSVIARDMNTKLIFANYPLNSENKITRGLVEQICEGGRRGRKWSRRVVAQSEEIVIVSATDMVHTPAISRHAE